MTVPLPANLTCRTYFGGSLTVSLIVSASHSAPLMVLLQGAGRVRIQSSIRSFTILHYLRLQLTVLAGNGSLRTAEQGGPTLV
jgi:hypothetical protein